MPRTHAIRFHEYGGPEVLTWEPVDLPEPAPGEARVRHTAVGLNFIDTYKRTGLYPVQLPSGLGGEAAGIVEAIGEGVKDVAPGDRVVYKGGPEGAYAERRNLAADLLVRIPDFLSDEQAAATFLKGLTSWYLLHRSYAVQAGDTIVIYAAAGGVGSLLCPWAKQLGARVIGIVSTDAKAALARAHGCDHVIKADDDDIVARVRSLTHGQGVPVVYDSAGRDTFFTSLDCLRRHGVMVSFGNSSGPVAPFSLSELARRGSLYVTRPTLADFVDTRDSLLSASATLFDFLGSSSTEIHIGQRYALRDVAAAHRDLAARRTIGSSVLIP